MVDLDLGIQDLDNIDMDKVVEGLYAPRSTTGYMEKPDLVTKPNEAGIVSYLYVELPQVQFITSKGLPVSIYCGGIIAMPPSAVTPECEDDMAKSPLNTYFCFGDQVDDGPESVVFICFMHLEDSQCPRPFAALCLQIGAFRRWLFPSDGSQPVPPPVDYWSLHSTVQFCTDNNRCVFAHVPDMQLFVKLIKEVINYFARAKKNPEFDCIFKVNMSIFVDHTTS